MAEFLQFAMLGLGLAAIYSLLSCGIVLIYRGSGVVNFAHGGFALVGAIVFHEVRPHMSVLLAVVVSMAAGAAPGAVVQNPVVLSLRRAAPVTPGIATPGLLLIIQ